MSMRVTRIGDAEPFSPVGHDNVGPVRLQGGTQSPTTDFTVALSHYLPGGAANLSAQPSETVYVIVSGELVMASEGIEEALGPFDSVHFTPGTMRTVENRTNLPASMLVIRTAS
ncbi:cupin domain-containing protein [Rhodococcus sp. G-MC3]|uniref:cupin domain-containing protein n=1 Tax=Rhodococcus sp. G-MC3 TaxID=3046209 RepID=UPI0024BB4025|nr:cupin domain-containing protein [Rhodococcus sp. G-MC3]MDJ0396431.1 cupin domain-containing protein [Rhodococcus sp. G-MC3]